MYSLVENGEIKRVNISLPTVVGNTSIPAGAQDLESFGLYPQVGSEPRYDHESQRLSGPSYVFKGSAVELVYSVENIPQDELDGKRRAAILDKIVVLQQKALRALIEDEDSTWLDKYKGQIAELRGLLN